MIKTCTNLIIEANRVITGSKTFCKQQSVVCSTLWDLILSEFNKHAKLNDTNILRGDTDNV